MNDVNANDNNDNSFEEVFNAWLNKTDEVAIDNAYDLIVQVFIWNSNEKMGITKEEATKQILNRVYAAGRTSMHAEMQQRMNEVLECL